MTTPEQRLFHGRQNRMMESNPAGTVWLQATNGREWHVDIGSPEHTKLIAEGAIEIEDPTA